MTDLLFLNIGQRELVLIAGLVLPPLVLMLYSLIDLLRSEFKEPGTKLLWLLIILALPLLGSLLYIMIGRNNKKKAG